MVKMLFKKWKFMRRKTDLLSLKLKPDFEWSVHKIKLSQKEKKYAWKLREKRYFETSAKSTFWRLIRILFYIYIYMSVLWPALCLPTPPNRKLASKKVRILSVVICTHTYSKQTNKSKPIFINSIIFGLVTFNNQPNIYASAFRKKVKLEKTDQITVTGQIQNGWFQNGEKKNRLVKYMKRLVDFTREHL